MTNFNFMSLLFIMLIIRNLILILGMACTLINIRIKLNLKSDEVNFKIFILFVVHIFYSTIDINNINENKSDFISISILMFLITEYMKVYIEDISEYLFEKYEEDNKIE